MKILISVLLCVLLFACSTEQPPTTNSQTDSESAVEPLKPAFTVDSTRYIGVHNTDKKVDAFLGVPFVQAPVGELRWMPPQPLVAASGVVQATSYGPACMQGPHLQNWYKNVITSFGGDPDAFPVPEVSEDCLYLNIWAPHDASSGSTKPLPVHVFIHGGSNKGGWSYEPNYIGETMASRGMIAVSVAYRVGAFGFFAHPELDHANFALLDQIAALQWVQDNIASIGGDPKRVTVAGESAGASNISYLIASPLAGGLFQRVIHQSAGWAMRGARNSQDAAALGTRLEKQVLAADVENGIEALRKASAEAILEASYEVYEDYFYDPVIDGHSITQSVQQAAAKGELAAVDLIIGTNANEALMYLDKTQTPQQWMAENVAELDPDKILAALNPDDSLLQQLDQLGTSYNYTCPSLLLAAANAANGGRSWVYHFTKVREGKLAAEMGAYHGAELPYIFDTHDDWLPTNQQDHQLTDYMARYWQQFVESGDPNLQRMPPWQAYLKAGSPVQTLGTEIDSSVHPSAELCEVLSQ